MLQLYKRLSDAARGIKDLDTKEGIVTGYFSCFGNKDSDGDIIMPGAFAKTIQENGPDSRLKRIKHCLDHRRDQVVGVLQVLKEDTYGLYYESKIARHTLAQDYLKMCEDKVITEHSIGYRVEKGNWDKVTDAYQLLELRLYEGSGLQFWGANPETPVTGIKADELTKNPDEVFTLLTVIEKALRNGKYSDETFAKLQTEYDQLGRLLQAKRTTEPDKTTQPDDDGKGKAQVVNLSDLKSFTSDLFTFH